MAGRVGYLSKNGRLKLKAGGKLRKLASIFSNPKLPGIEDYYEPWSSSRQPALLPRAEEHSHRTPEVAAHRRAHGHQMVRQLGRRSGWNLCQSGS